MNLSVHYIEWDYIELKLGSSGSSCHWLDINFLPRNSSTPSHVITIYARNVEHQRAIAATLAGDAEVELVKRKEPTP